MVRPSPAAITPLAILIVWSTIQVKSFPIQSIGQENDRPIIGILVQELSDYMIKMYGDEQESYIAASYVKSVESAGARVVPIWIGQPATYYSDVLSKINGIFWPGGEAEFDRSGGFSAAGQIIYRIAREMNDRGDFFPIWGTCLGFELLTYLAANGVEHRTNCSSNNQVLPIIFKPNFTQSRMFQNVPQDIIDILRTENVTANFHDYCVTEEDMAKVNLTDSFRIMSVNQDSNGLEFISTLEHINYPFYGVQFHPEKNNYEWVRRSVLPHTRNSIRASQYFVDFFVDEARKNKHHFSSPEEEIKNLIYNYIPDYTAGLTKSVFQQVYFFKKQPKSILKDRSTSNSSITAWAN
ncbi:gamma-glutamyl hydrolase-like [Fopius arisanus]|uniref:folate gamma-glutamyl hydrolase n=1 Tax=Fopius arisanus TaxID=64838 RepID=A0A9R1TJZ1_9HYME|nr:PREDICTED: gamma-glutamyl hydrolase-like [Fopius arisanus]